MRSEKRVEAGRLAGVGALLGALAVVLGAFGAHALESRLEMNGRIEIWKTATLYHLVHAGAVVVAGVVGARVAGWILVAGVLVFSGSLYLLAYLDAPGLGAVAPVGGLLLIVGWLVFAVALFRRGRNPDSDSVSPPGEDGLG